MQPAHKGSQQKNRAATVRDVAERAGVHPGTVSRALQGDSRVAPATLQNIQRIARELNFTPNLAARTLLKGKTETIAIAINMAQEHYYAQVLHYLEKELTACNYKRLLLGSKDLERDLLSIVNSHAVDGVIAVDTFPRIDELIISHNTSMLPCVYAGVADPHWTQLSSVDIVKVDLSRAALKACNTMIENGCQRIAYLATFPDQHAGSDVRIQMYENALCAVNQPTEIINLDIGGFEMLPELFVIRLNDYFDRCGTPDGLFCHNDEIAMVTHRVLHDRGLRIPEDVQLVGCDGLSYMNYFQPPLSTVVQPADEMCSLAWQFLQRRMLDPGLPQQVATLEATLRVRPSLAPHSP
jgi:DNA-binding LacI/PurR family transcriptional regulator